MAGKDLINKQGLAIAAQDLIIEQSDFVPMPVVDDQGIIDQALLLRDIRLALAKQPNESCELQNMHDVEAGKLIEAILKANNLYHLLPDDNDGNFD